MQPEFANSVDPDQTLIWVCTVYPGLSVRKFRIITVEALYFGQNKQIQEVYIFIFFHLLT